jgi:excisionase family DNA binding protein
MGREGNRPANDDKPRPRDPLPDPLAYGVKDAARAMSVSEGTVWTWIRERKVSAVRLGGRTVIAREELLRLLSDRAA